MDNRDLQSLQLWKCMQDWFDAPSVGWKALTAALVTLSLVIWNGVRSRKTNVKFEKGEETPLENSVQSVDLNSHSTSEDPEDAPKESLLGSGVFFEDPGDATVLLETKEAVACAHLSERTHNTDFPFQASENSYPASEFLPEEPSNNTVLFEIDNSIILEDHDLKSSPPTSTEDSASLPSSSAVKPADSPSTTATSTGFLSTSTVHLSSSPSTSTLNPAGCSSTSMVHFTTSPPTSTVNPASSPSTYTIHPNSSPSKSTINPSGCPSTSTVHPASSQTTSTEDPTGFPSTSSVNPASSSCTASVNPTSSLTTSLVNSNGSEMSTSSVSTAECKQSTTFVKKLTYKQSTSLDKKSEGSKTFSEKPNTAVHLEIESTATVEGDLLESFASTSTANIAGSSSTTYRNPASSQSTSFADLAISGLSTSSVIAVECEERTPSVEVDKCDQSSMVKDKCEKCTTTVKKNKPKQSTSSGKKDKSKQSISTGKKTKYKQPTLSGEVKCRMLKAFSTYENLLKAELPPNGVFHRYSQLMKLIELLHELVLDTVNKMKNPSHLLYSTCFLNQQRSANGFMKGVYDKMCTSVLRDIHCVSSTLEECCDFIIFINESKCDDLAHIEQVLLIIERIFLRGAEAFRLTVVPDDRLKLRTSRILKKLASRLLTIEFETSVASASEEQYDFLRKKMRSEMEEIKEQELAEITKYFGRAKLAVVKYWREKGLVSSGQYDKPCHENYLSLYKKTPRSINMGNKTVYYISYNEPNLPPVPRKKNEIVIDPINHGLRLQHFIRERDNWRNESSSASSSRSAASARPVPLPKLTKPNYDSSIFRPFRFEKKNVYSLDVVPVEFLYNVYAGVQCDY